MSNSISKFLAAGIFSLSMLAPAVISSPVSAAEAVVAPAVIEETIEKNIFQVTKVVVKARPDQVWQVLTDYNSAPAVFKTVKKCQVLSDKGSTKLIRHEIKPSGLLTSFTYEIEVKEVAHRTLEWHRVSGDFKEVDGFWKLDPVDGGRCTMVTYASHVDGGIFMPKALIKRQCRIDMPQAIVALKEQTERTLQIASRREANHTP